MPKVSVILPVYNGERYLREAIESVLNQTYRDFELIVVDDGSLDKTREIISQYESQYFCIKAVYHQENKGVSAAKNSGIAVSSGEMLMFAGADDIQEPKRLEIMVKTLEGNPALDMVFIDCNMVSGEGEPLNRHKGYPKGMTSANAVLYQLKRNHLWSGLVMMYKTADIWFDESIPNAVDYELFLRLVLKGVNFEIIHQPLVRYRIHQKNISGNAKRSKKSVEDILQKLDFDKILMELSAKFDEDEVRVAIAGALLTSGQYERALRALQNSKLGLGILMEGLFIQGISFYKLGQMQESLDVFNQAQHVSKDEAAILNNIGVLSLLLHKEREVAQLLFVKALTLRPGYLDALNNIQCVKEENYSGLRITEKPLRDNFIHIENYKI